MNPADFEAKPMVLIVGQYSVGKTSFIRSLLKKDFPGQRVGPEPTTDRCVRSTGVMLLCLRGCLFEGEASRRMLAGWRTVGAFALPMTESKAITPCSCLHDLSTRP